MSENKFHRQQTVGQQPLCPNCLSGHPKKTINSKFRCQADNCNDFHFSKMHPNNFNVTQVRNQGQNQLLFRYSHKADNLNKTVQVPKLRAAITPSKNQNTRKKLTKIATDSLAEANTTATTAIPTIAALKETTEMVATTIVKPETDFQSPQVPKGTQFRATAVIFRELETSKSALKIPKPENFHRLQ